MDSENMTWKFGLITTAILIIISFFLGGTGWAIGVGVFCFLAVFQLMYDQWKNEKESNEAYEYKPVTNDTFARKTHSSPNKEKLIDKIQFYYRPKDGEESIYTVDVYKGINGNIEGFCHERGAVREFRKDRILNDEITRIETGEVLSVKEWRKAMVKNKA